MRRSDRMVSRLDQMLTDAINGSFVEASYDETELSRLESKFRQYLTEKEISKERLQAEREAIKSLVTDISHQTKTPIANISLYSQLLEEISPAELLPYVQQIRMQAEKLDFLIRMLTKLSRLESEMMILKPVSQPVAPLLEKAVREARGRGDAKGVAVCRAGAEIWGRLPREAPSSAAQIRESGREDGRGKDGKESPVPAKVQGKKTSIPRYSHAMISRGPRKLWEMFWIMP